MSSSSGSSGIAAGVSEITSGLRNADGGAPDWASAGSLSSCVPPGVLPRLLRREEVRLVTCPVVVLSVAAADFWE